MTTSTKKVTKALISSLLGASAVILGYKIYKRLSSTHIALISSAALKPLVQKCPLPFSTKAPLPALVSGLQNLPQPVFEQYCFNILYSSSTTSTSKVLEDYFSEVNSGLVYVADVQTAGLGRTGN